MLYCVFCTFCIKFFSSAPYNIISYVFCVCYNVFNIVLYSILNIILHYIVYFCTILYFCICAVLFYLFLCAIFFIVKDHMFMYSIVNIFYVLLNSTLSYAVLFHLQFRFFTLPLCSSLFCNLFFFIFGYKKTHLKQHYFELMDFSLAIVLYSNKFFYAVQ